MTEKEKWEEIFIADCELSLQVLQEEKAKEEYIKEREIKEQWIKTK